MSAKYTDIMLDLETLSTSPNAAIISLGAVQFNPVTGDIGPTFYKVVNIDDAVKHGEVDGATIAWWMRQDDAARSVINCEDSKSLLIALLDFTSFLMAMDKPTTQRVWGNGATFDNVILRAAYKKLNLIVPWDFYNDRDVRTVVDVGRQILNIDPKKTLKFKGTKHNAVDDAIHQAKYVSAIYKAMQDNAGSKVQ